MNKALTTIEKVIKAKGGKFEKKGEARVVGEKEEVEENESVDGPDVVMSDEENEEGINVELPCTLII